MENFTASFVLNDVITSNETNTGGCRGDLTTSLWRWVWPLLCVTGLVGNTLVLLVLRRDGLLRTSANVYVTALAVGDNMVLMVASVAIYPSYVWDFWVSDTSTLACRALLPANHTLVTASFWFVAAFTVERYVATHCLLLKLSIHTPRKAGVCCLSLLVLAFVKNIDLCVTSAITDNGSGDAACYTLMRYRYYVYHVRPWMNIVLNTALPLAIVLGCSGAIIRQLRRELMPTAVRESVTRTTLMCLSVSFAFVICVVPVDMFVVTESYWPITPSTRTVIFSSLVLLRYTNHAINVFLFSLTGAHFRSELVALFCSSIQCACAAAAIIRRMPSRFSGRFNFRRGFGENFFEMR